MANQGLLFIPDISGFSKFVQVTEIDHSRQIIQELLEILINANDSGLEISEVEGDAILFYKFGAPPAIADLYKQVEKMFQEFHKSLIAYNHLRYCQCHACSSVLELTLKVITHYGEFTGYNVKNFSKLIGKDLIVAHQLLKNDIPQHEYWLVTDSIFTESGSRNVPAWMRWNRSAKQTEGGEVVFHFAQLGQLKNDLAIPAIGDPDLAHKSKEISISATYDTDIITLFHATGDFRYRDRWVEGVLKVEEVNHYLPRVGMKCRCVHENGESNIFASSYRYTPEKIEFSETDGHHQTTYFTLEKSARHLVKLTIDVYVEKSLVANFSFDTEQKIKMEERLTRSLESLREFVGELKIPSAEL